MNWVERRIAKEASIPAVWDLLCIEMEQAVKTFDGKYAFEQRMQAKTYRKGDCLHVTLDPLYPSEKNAPARRSINICLEGEQVISRKAGEKVWEIGFIADTSGTACFVETVDAEKGKELRMLTNDEVSQKFLESFLFLKPFAGIVLHGSPRLA